jgi:hypothetical protein
MVTILRGLCDMVFTSPEYFAQLAGESISLIHGLNPNAANAEGLWSLPLQNRGIVKRTKGTAVVFYCEPLDPIQWGSKVHYLFAEITYQISIA